MANGVAKTQADWAATGGTVFASLGSVTFGLLNSPQAISATNDYHYEVIPVIDGTPQTQWTYDDLERLQIELVLHQFFTDPSSAEGTLRALAETHIAQPLVFSNGLMEGNFCITRLKREDIWRADDGTIIAVSLSMDLLESSLQQSVATGFAGLSPAIIGSTTQPPTPIYSGTTSAATPDLPAPVAGLPATTFAASEPLYPTIPLLPYTPAVGGVTQSGSFLSVSLSAASRWGAS